MREAFAHSAGRVERNTTPVTLFAFALLTNACAWVVAAPATSQAISANAISISTPASPALGFLGTVHLDAPDLDLVVTAPLSDRDGLPARTAAKLEDTQTFALREKTELAVNANYFGWLGKKANGEPAEILGACVSNSQVLSPARVYEGIPDPALAFFVDPAGGVVAKIGRLTNEDLQGAIAAVAGIGASATTPLNGSLIVTDGKNTGDQARVEPEKRHPRTAVGVSPDGKTLYVVVIDGRQPDHSVGVTLPELADYFLSIGATNAVNLDGGGSSAFIYTPATGDALINKPSDGKFRPVAVNLGFRPRVNSGPADGVPKPEAKPAGASR
ncbi:MAG: phosphodiester glycosidase family protein [Phycisphaerales bacterium]|nr:phosphodiester glycosidase family protein [Phycisphaerales bacterium]